MKNIEFLAAEIITVARTNKGDAVFIKPLQEKNDRVVPIFIRPFESQALLFVLSNISVPRPLTHDLLIEMLNQLKTTIEKVEITEIKDQTFYSRIVLRQGMKKIQIDARPSDSLNIALRCGCPLYIAEPIIGEVGINLSIIADKDAVAEDAAPEDEPHTDLQEQLQQAIASENYEEAARIRDQLNNS